MPPPLLVNVPISALVADTNTWSVAEELVLVASTLNCCLETTYSACPIDTVSPVAAGFTVSVAVRLTPPNDAVIVTEVDAVTAVVVIVKFAEVAPAATITLAGTLATALLLLERVTAAPPAGAAAVSVTVPCEELPPTTLVRLRVSDDRVALLGVVTVSNAVFVAPPNAPVMFAEVDAVTAVVVTAKLALVAPADTVTLAGTPASAALLESKTPAPPEGAAAVKVTVPVEGFPPTTLVGLSVSEARVTLAGGATKS